MRRVFIVVLIIATTIAVTNVVRGDAATGAQITGTLAPAPGYSQVIHRNVTFRIGIAAIDPSTNDYMVSVRPAVPTTHLTYVFMTCAGTQANRPSADMPSCEYDDDTTTTHTTTHSAIWVRWSGAIGSRFSLRLCAEDISTSNCRTINYSTVA